MAFMFHSYNNYIICKEQNCNKLHNVNGGVPVCSKSCGLVASQRKFKKKEWSKLVRHSKGISLEIHTQVKRQFESF